MAASSENQWSDQLDSFKAGGLSILKKPCVRNSLMAGIATGTFMGIHRVRIGRTVPQACRAACFTFIVGSCIHMVACSYQLRRKYDELDRAMELQGGIRASEAHGARRH
ncbi:unnamed protein product [Ascophyllum nodosum]